MILFESGILLEIANRLVAQFPSPDGNGNPFEKKFFFFLSLQSD
jgi:hypothetical protein